MAPLKATALASLLWLHARIDDGHTVVVVLFLPYLFASQRNSIRIPHGLAVLPCPGDHACMFATSILLFQSAVSTNYSIAREKKKIPTTVVYTTYYLFPLTRPLTCHLPSIKLRLFCRRLRPHCRYILHLLPLYMSQQIKKLNVCQVAGDRPDDMYRSWTSHMHAACKQIGEVL